MSDIGSSPNTLHTARGVVKRQGALKSELTTECGVGKSSVSWSSELA